MAFQAGDMVGLTFGNSPQIGIIFLVAGDDYTISRFSEFADGAG